VQRRPELPAVPPGGEIDPFELFCAYHLGITADDGYHIQNIHEVARRFGTNAAALRQTLAAYGMDADDIVHSGFDLASAQIDIMVAPAGISRRELARPLFDEFRSAPRKARDWAREMAEADRQIEQTIGHDGRWSPPPRDRAGKQS
jgi:transposase-like protein